MVAVHSHVSGAVLFQQLGYTASYLNRWRATHRAALARSAALFEDDLIPAPQSLLGLALPPPLPILAPNPQMALTPALFAPPRPGGIQGGGNLSHLLAADPFLRQQLEMQLGGRCRAAHGRTLCVERFPPGLAFAANAPPAFAGALESLAAFSAAFAALPVAMAANSFNAVFGSVCAHGLGRIVSSDPGHYGFGQRPHGSVSEVLADPTLTVEDKVTLMIMMIMKEMDKEIEKQAEYINQLQKKSGGNGGKGGKGKGGFMGIGKGKGGGGGGKKDASIDVETMKLKRLIDKRGQMFDMLRQIIDKYNETAKNIIQSMGR